MILQNGPAWSDKMRIDAPELFNIAKTADFAQFLAVVLRVAALTVRVPHAVHVLRSFKG